MLRFTEMTVRRVECHELEDFIRIEVYGFDDPEGNFSIVAMEKWGNDSCHFFAVKKKPLSEYERTMLEEWKQDPLGRQTHFLHFLYVILQDMANNGHIEEGNWLISVSW